MTEFVYRQPTFAVEDVAGQAHSLHEEGYALVPGVLSPEEVADLRDAVDRLKPFGFDKWAPTSTTSASSTAIRLS